MDAGRWFRVRCGKAWRSAGGGKTVSCPAAGGLGSEAAQSPPPPPACCPGRAATAGGGLLDRCSRSRFLAFAGLNGKQVRAPGHAFCMRPGRKACAAPATVSGLPSPNCSRAPWRAAVTAFLRPENGFSERAREGWGLAASAARHAPPAAVRKPGYRPASSLFVGGCGRAVGRPGLFLFPCLPCGLGCVRQAVLGLPAPLLSWHGGRAKAALSALFPLACAAFCNAVCAWAQTHEEKNACFPLTPRRLRRFARCLSRWLALLRLHRRTPKPGK